MRTSEQNLRRPDDGVEIVAAESDDGSFELHVTRMSGPNSAVPSRDPAPAPISSAEPEGQARSGRHPAQKESSSRTPPGALVVAVVALVGLGIAALASGRDGDASEPSSAVIPQTTEPDAGFRVFHIQQPVVQTVRYLDFDLDGGIDLGAPEQRDEADAGTLTPRVAGPQAQPEDRPAIGEAARPSPASSQILEAREEVEVRHLDELTVERLRQVQVEVPVDPRTLVLPEDEWDRAEDGADPSYDDE